ncbi:hypothetical protein PR048_004430 [Dryococelus australis]|uniref:RNA-directed DNA polymerase n=1 Tax=Dryococelus australis TaxID=614101 RepID=A0ABQ9I5F5_9NEOP|nr:hypothetical protein PR048_004430 [Dryococelus australis]
MSYFDDIIFHGSTREECQHNLTACLHKIQKFDLHLNQQKCSLFQEIFLGNGNILLSSHSVEPSISQHNNFAVLCVRTQFSKGHLHVKRPDVPAQLVCDASPTGIAGILSCNLERHEHPIAFASRLLIAAEHNYSQLDKESLAIVFTVDHFFQYLFGTVNTIIQSLGCPTKDDSRSPSLIYSLPVKVYVHYRLKKGTENSNVDCLFRAPIKINTYIDSAINNVMTQLCDATIEQISVSTGTYPLLKEETKNNATLSTSIESLQEENTSEPDYITESGILFRGQQVVVPASLQSAVLNELHRTHVGITKMKKLARRYVYWMKIDSDIEHLI